MGRQTNKKEISRETTEEKVDDKAEGRRRQDRINERQCTHKGHTNNRRR